MEAKEKETTDEQELNEMKCDNEVFLRQLSCVVPVGRRPPKTMASMGTPAGSSQLG